LFREIAAAIKPIGVGERFVGLFAVEKNKLDPAGQLPPLRQHAGQLEQHAGARTAVVCADKLRVVENFRVVMRTDKKRGSGLTAEGREQINELDIPARRLIRETLALDFPAGRLQLRDQI